MHDTTLSELTHVSYLSDNKWVCEDPQRLDHLADAVINEFSTWEKPYCKTCNQLLLAATVRHQLADTAPATYDNYGVAYIPADERTGRGAYRGMVYGFLFTSIFWAIIIALFVAF